jgi:PhoPQ-activated pathogenicity-related protein
MVSFYQAILTNTPRPEYSWTKNRDGSLSVRSKTRPREVNLWAAHNPNARDFRLDTLGPAYRKTTLQPQRNGSYLGRPPETETGFTAFFVELVYDGPAGKQPFKFTTEVSVVPDTKPYKWADALKRPRSTPEERRALTRPEGAPAPAPRAGG